jgi:hypothetical protein
MACSVNGNPPAPARPGFRLAALIASVICVLALAAAAFVLSYPGARDTARIAGVSPRLARIYPVIFDAVLVVGCAAAVTLRGLLRAYAWVAILVVIGTVAAADAVHAMSVALPKRPLEATVAIVPWVVLLIGFTLLYAMAWQTWPGRRAAASRAAANGAASGADKPGPAAKPAGTAPVPLSALLAGKTAGSGTSAAADSGAGGDAREAGDAGAAGKTSPSTSEAPPASAAGKPAVGAAKPAVGGAAKPAASEAPAAVAVAVPQSPLPSRRAPERDDPSDADAAPVDPSGAHFNRLRSTPTPPGE